MKPKSVASMVFMFLGAVIVGIGNMFTQMAMEKDMEDMIDEKIEERLSKRDSEEDEDS